MHRIFQQIASLRIDFPLPLGLLGFIVVAVASLLTIAAITAAVIATR